MLVRLEPNETLARSRVHLGLAWLAASLWYPTQAQRHLRQVESAELVAAPDMRMLFHNVSAWIAMTLGDLRHFEREHAAWVDAARDMSSKPALAAAYFNGAVCYTNFSLHERAISNIEKAMNVARESRNRHSEESTHALSASCYFLSGDLARARAAVEAVPATTENKVNIAYVAAWGTLAGLHLGDDDLVLRCFDRYEQMLMEAPEIETGAAFAEVLVRRRRFRDAEAVLRRAIPDREMLRGNALTLLAAGRYGATEERIRARAYLARAAESPIETLERPALALFDAEALRRDQNIPRARQKASEAAAGFHRLHTPLLEAAALEIAGRLEEALTLFRRCGASYDIRRLSNGVSSQSQDQVSKREVWHKLSSREREIAQLAAAGRSNREIASQLSIAEKTVEKHLASTFHKLGIASRNEL